MSLGFGTVRLRARQLLDATDGACKSGRGWARDRGLASSQVKPAPSNTSAGFVLWERGSSVVDSNRRPRSRAEADLFRRQALPGTRRVLAPLWLRSSVWSIRRPKGSRTGAKTRGFGTDLGGGEELIITGQLQPAIGTRSDLPSVSSVAHLQGVCRYTRPVNLAGGPGAAQKSRALPRERRL